MRQDTDRLGALFGLNPTSSTFGVYCPSAHCPGILMSVKMSQAVEERIGKLKKLLVCPHLVCIRSSSSRLEEAAVLNRRLTEVGNLGYVLSFWEILSVWGALYAQVHFSIYINVIILKNEKPHLFLIINTVHVMNY